MSTTLFNAPEYDPIKARRRTVWIIGILCVALVVAAVVWLNRYWPEKRHVERFFTALEAKDFERAYGVWMNDADWKQHPEAYKRYQFRAFYQDWGPGGEWGPIHSHKIIGAQKPNRTASGVVVGVRVNDRKQLCSVRVEFKDKTLGFSPDEMVE
jgi:hypothetical protein